jgi:hypothetical protein
VDTGRFAYILPFLSKRAVTDSSVFKITTFFPRDCRQIISPTRKSAPRHGSYTTRHTMLLFPFSKHEPHVFHGDVKEVSKSQILLGPGGNVRGNAPACEELFLWCRANHTNKMPERRNARMVPRSMARVKCREGAKIRGIP